MKINIIQTKNHKINDQVDYQLDYHNLIKKTHILSNIKSINLNYFKEKIRSVHGIT